MVASEGIASPTGRDIDGKYLDQNEQDLKSRYVKFQKDWPLFGVTLMCDSWTGPTRMSVINFLIYCNGVTWFHKSIDASGRTEDAAYLFKVLPKHVPFTLNMLLNNMSLFAGDSKGAGRDWTGECRARSHRQRLKLQESMQVTSN